MSAVKIYHKISVGNNFFKKNIKYIGVQRGPQAVVLSGPPGHNRASRVRMGEGCEVGDNGCRQLRARQQHMRAAAVAGVGWLPRARRRATAGQGASGGRVRLWLRQDSEATRPGGNKARPWSDCCEAAGRRRGNMWPITCFQHAARRVNKRPAAGWWGHRTARLQGYSGKAARPRAGKGPVERGCRWAAQPHVGIMHCLPCEQAAIKCPWVMEARPHKPLITARPNLNNREPNCQWLIILARKF